VVVVVYYVISTRRLSWERVWRCTSDLELDMDSATDTDSEADHLDAAPYVSPSEDTSSNLKDVHTALQGLRAIETRRLVKVPHSSTRREPI
jgi:hypothetical protein